MYVHWLSVFFFFYNDFSFAASVVSSGIERLDWRLGGRTGVTARGVKPFRLWRGTFDLDLPGEEKGNGYGCVRGLGRRNRVSEESFRRQRDS